MRILLCTAPMVQINTPYPATAVLVGYLRSARPDITTIQRDPALDLILRLFSRDGLTRIKREIGRKKNFFSENFSEYADTVEPVIAFLQGKDSKFETKIRSRKYLPEGPRFAPLNTQAPLKKSFSDLPKRDQAEHLASLYVDDLADVIREFIDPRFEFARYGERLAASQISLTPLLKSLETETLVDKILSEVIADYLRELKPDLLGISAPFSGTVYGAFRIAHTAKKLAPKVKITLGGGYPNTELRSLSDPRVFDFFDFVTLDDGERPLSCILEHLEGKRIRAELFRTFLREKGKVVFINSPRERDVPFRATNIPTYDGLPMDRYVPLFEMLNPVNRLWTGYRWNKLTLAHGCYWRRCSFCDVSLDYISRFEPQEANKIADTMVRIAEETGETGFHFVDEAAPPALLKALSRVLLERNLKFRWWGNIRFDNLFTPETTDLMAKAGCIAVTGGLEVASDRLLKLINKGVSIEQVARVTKAFRDSGIFVHAYLMYGFPTQTDAETVESLEVVRQLFQNECIHSAFWHRFAATIHSPVGKNPKAFGISLEEPRAPKDGVFSRNDVPFHDPTPADHDSLGEGLKTALYNYMHGVGLDWDVREWFPHSLPKPKVAKNFIKNAIAGV